MTSKRQIEANRGNAASSTGPRTAEGKERSALNALQHGLTAESPVLPSEDTGRYEAFRFGLRKDLAPRGATEDRLADEIADLSRRLVRVSNLELGVLAGGVAAVDQRFFHGPQRRQEIRHGDILSAEAGPSLDEVIELVNEEAHDVLAVRISDTEEIQRSDEVRLAAAFTEDAAGPNALGKLSRYEANLFRRRNQALAALASLRAQRSDFLPEDSE